MTRKLDVTGQRFGKLVVLECKNVKSNNGDFIWICKCDCGNTVESPVGQLRSGARHCCKECGRPGRYTHSLSHTKEYKAWNKMKARCYRPNDSEWSYLYEGVTVCERWLESFENFYADMGPRPAGTSLDRIDPSGNYEPSNCRWTNPTEQSYNQKLHSSNKSGKSGVYFREDRNKWCARISKERKHYHLGHFDTFEEAVAAREKAELELYGYNKQ